MLTIKSNSGFQTSALVVMGGGGPGRDTVEKFHILIRFTVTFLGRVRLEKFHIERKIIISNYDNSNLHTFVDTVR